MLSFGGFSEFLIPKVLAILALSYKACCSISNFCLYVLCRFFYWSLSRPTCSNQFLRILNLRLVQASFSTLFWCSSSIHFDDLAELDVIRSKLQISSKIFNIPVVISKKSWISMNYFVRLPFNLLVNVLPSIFKYTTATRRAWWTFVSAASSQIVR